MMRRTLYLVAVVVAFALGAAAQSSDCNEPSSSPSVTLPLPASPFTAVPSADGCWVFVSMTGGRGTGPGIAVVKHSGGQLNLERTVDLTSAPSGIVLTRDGRLLVAAAGQAELFVDTAKLMSGDAGAVIGSISGGRSAVYANITPDDKTLFVSQESGGTITVIDLERARAGGFDEKAVLGEIPTGEEPIALTFSSDGKYLFTTSERAAPEWKWPRACKPEGLPIPDTLIVDPEGAVEIIGVSKARTDPTHAVLARVPAGCSPVRMAMSPAGDRVYVTARNSNAVVAFDTSKLISDAAHAQVAIAPTGDAPVPVAVVDQGRRVIIGNSNRFAAGNAPQSLDVVDVSKIDKGAAAVVGIVPAGAFPREMRISADGRTLFLTNFGSNSLQMLDISRLQIDTTLPPEIASNAEALAKRDARKPVVIPPDLLAAYAGVYQGGLRTYVVWVDGDHLSLGLSPPALPSTLLPASETTFYMASGNKLEFSEIAPGQRIVDHLVFERPAIPGRAVERDAAKRLDDTAGQPYLDAATGFQQRVKNGVPAPGSEVAANKLIAELQAGKADASEFEFGSLGGFGQGLDQLQSQAAKIGAIQSFTFSGVGPTGPDNYLIKSANGTWLFRIWLLPDGKFNGAGLAIQPTGRG